MFTPAYQVTDEPLPKRKREEDQESDHDFLDESTMHADEADPEKAPSVCEVCQ